MNVELIPEDTEQEIVVEAENVEKEIEVNNENAIFYILGDKAYVAEIIEEFNDNAKEKTEEFNLNAKKKNK